MQRRRFIGTVSGFVTGSVLSGCSEAVCQEEYGYGWEVNSELPDTFLKHTSGWRDGTIEVTVGFENRSVCDVETVQADIVVHDPDGAEITSATVTMNDVSGGDSAQATTEIDIGDALDDYATSYHWEDVVSVTIDVQF